jgi:hypothetical protein
MNFIFEQRNADERLFFSRSHYVFENIRRFQAVIQHINLNFTNNMRLRGFKFAFGVGPSDEERETE